MSAGCSGRCVGPGCSPRVARRGEPWRALARPVAEAHARSLARFSSSSRAGARASAAPIWTARPFSSAADHAKPPAEIFGVVKVGAQQFKVVPDDLIVVEKLGELKVNDPVVLSEVMMLGTAERTVIGRPSVPGAAVHAVVEEHFREAKKLAFKKKRRKGYQRAQGTQTGASSDAVASANLNLSISPRVERRASSESVSSTDRLTSLSLLTRFLSRAGTHVSEDIADRRDGRPELMTRGEA